MSLLLFPPLYQWDPGLERVQQSPGAVARRRHPMLKDTACVAEWVATQWAPATGCHFPGTGTQSFPPSRHGHPSRKQVGGADAEEAE